MFSLDTPFTLLKCEPVTAAFGSFGYTAKGMQRSYMPSDVASGMKEVIESAAKSFEKAYGVKAAVEAKSSTLTATICPIQASLRDLDILDIRSHNKTYRAHDINEDVEKLCDMMLLAKTETGVIPKISHMGYDILHILPGSFDPQAAGGMIEEVGKLMLGATHNSFTMPRMLIDDGCLRVDLKVGSDRRTGYIV